MRSHLDHCLRVCAVCWWKAQTQGLSTGRSAHPGICYFKLCHRKSFLKSGPFVIYKAHGPRLVLQKLSNSKCFAVIYQGNICPFINHGINRCRADCCSKRTQIESRVAIISLKNHSTFEQVRRQFLEPVLEMKAFDWRRWGGLYWRRLTWNRKPCSS